jgi:hypothetical protein
MNLYVKWRGVDSNDVLLLEFISFILYPVTLLDKKLVTLWLFHKLGVFKVDAGISSSSFHLNVAYKALKQQ